MLWLVIAVISYFLFALTSLGDRYILSGPPKAVVYAFYVGVLGMLSLLLVPFVEFSLVSPLNLLLCLLAGVVFFFFTLSMYSGLEKFKASTIVPAFGGFLPVFTFLLTLVFSGGDVVLKGWNFAAFVLLILGSVLITKSPSGFSFKGLKISLVAALFASLYFVLAKYAFILLGFWTGFIWIRVGAFISALFLVFSGELRKEIFRKEFSFDRKTTFLFFSIQGLGAVAVILQNWAVDLAGLALIAVVNALQGVQYVFLFGFALLFSWKTEFLEERISKKLIFKKGLAVAAISLGLALLALT